MKKNERQHLIRQILHRFQIERQEEFVSRLKDEDVLVTQATISRDIKEMHLIKVPAKDGGYKYSLPIEKSHDVEKSFKRSLIDACLSIDTQEYFVLIKVLPGNGQSIAALIDQMKFDQVMGTIGGDDTILVMTKGIDNAIEFQSYLNEIIEG